MFQHRFICCRPISSVTMTDALIALEKESEKVSTRKRKTMSAESKEELTRDFKMAQIEKNEVVAANTIPFSAQNV